MSATHYLKTWPAFWHAVERGDKNFEVRKDDRAFQAGDTLALEYYEPDPRPEERGYRSAPSVLFRHVTFVLRGGQFGIEPGYVVMGIIPVENAEASDHA
jgi:hypothetical protein